MKAVNLRTEYLTGPVGIDIVKPRFFWNCEGCGMQSSYRIVATDESGRVRWDSGTVKSSRMTGVRWEGDALQSRDRIRWRVMASGDGEGEWSEEAVFELGLLAKPDWTASWITGDYRPDRKERYPADCFRKSFALREKPVRARLYCSACGLYEGEINGRRTGDFILAPGITDYRKRVQYQTVDVTDLVREGANEMTFTLADGWYRGSVGAWGMRCYYGTETKLIAQLECFYEDGSREAVGTDGSWEWSNDGPVRFADLKDGEIAEASRVPSYAGRARVTSHSAPLTASNNVPVKEQERLSVKRVLRTPSGKTVLDFGQNIAGYAEFCLTACEGDRVFLRFGEMLDADGEFTQKNIQCSNKRKTTPLQQVEYICREGENRYKTRFAIFGFQYVLVESEVMEKCLWELCGGMPGGTADDAADKSAGIDVPGAAGGPSGAVPPEVFSAVAVSSDLRDVLRFECSEPMLEKLVSCVRWSAKNNSADLPTDCPTRERHGWTGDAQIFFNTAGYLLDYAAFARKYERDLTDWQSTDPKGRFPQIAPEGGTDPYMRVMNGSVGWADAGVMIPYRFWKLYGDEDILRENYEAMRRYTEFMVKRLGKRGLFSKKLGLPGEFGRYAVNTGQAYGEWLEPADVHPMSWTDCVVPHPEVATAYTAYVLSLMAEIAEALGRTEDAERYGSLAAKVKEAYAALRGMPEYTLDTDRQALLVRPLYFGLLRPEQEEYAKKRLVKALENYGWRVGTGFLSTPLILDVLSGIDIEAAYRLLENEEMPGWLFMVKSGANTIWESWEGITAKTGIASLDHYSKGACVEWMVRTMCGIGVAGRNRFRIAPKPGGSLRYAGASYESIYGRVSCRWEKISAEAAQEGPAAYLYKVTVPGNTTAEFVFPDGEIRLLVPGEYVLAQQEPGDGF